jgi:hypothetical protein
MIENPSNWELLEAICGGLFVRKPNPKELLAEIRANSTQHYPEECQDDPLNYECNWRRENPSNEAVTMTESWDVVKQVTAEMTPIAKTRGTASRAGNPFSLRLNLATNNNVDAKSNHKANWNETNKNRMKSPGKCGTELDWTGLLDPGDLSID